MVRSLTRPPPVQTRNPTPFRRPTYPQSGGGCRLDCLAFLLPPFLPPPKSETLGPVQRGKADLPAAPGWGRPIPTTGIAGTKGPPPRQAEGGRSHIQGRAPHRDRWGKGQNHHTSAPQTLPPCFPQLTHIVCSGSFSKRWVLDTGFSTKGCHRRRFGRDASRGRRGGV